MKLEYNSIVGMPDPNGHCLSCCFRSLNSCLPNRLYPCFCSSFEKSQSDVFKL